MRLEAYRDLPRRKIGANTSTEWFDIFDEFAMSGEQQAEIVGHEYNDPWTAQQMGKMHLAEREVISGYLTKFKLDVIDSRLFIIRR